MSLFKYKFILILTFLFLGLSQQGNLLAAEITQTSRTYNIYGEIAPGDYIKLLKLINNNEPGYRIRLNSNGGDVNEAIKIGELVNRLNLETFVFRGDYCASACFFIWLNGERRFARRIQQGVDQFNIGLHRPFLATVNTGQASRQKQIEIQRQTTKYLEDKLIPRRIIDLMMSRPSNEVYWLTEADLFEIGEYPPHIEELYIAKCDYDKSWEIKWYNLMLQRRYTEAKEVETANERFEDCSIDLHIERLIRGRQAFINRR